MQNTVQQVFSEFNQLKQAIIDASSIIYVNKSGFLQPLANILTLFSLVEIFEETGYSRTSLPIKLIEIHDHQLTNDQKIIQAVTLYKYPVISDDQKILLSIKKKKIPFYNAVMMLNFLLFKKNISIDNYHFYHQKLCQYSRYSPPVLLFSENIYKAILAQKELKT